MSGLRFKWYFVCTLILFKYCRGTWGSSVRRVSGSVSQSTSGEGPGFRPPQSVLMHPIITVRKMNFWENKMKTIKGMHNAYFNLLLDLMDFKLRFKLF